MFEKLRILFYYVVFKYFHRFNSIRCLEKYQNKKLKHLIKKVSIKSKFYNKSKIEKFQNIPIIDKKEFMENFNIINTVNMKLDEAFNVSIKGEISRNFKPKVGKYTVGLSSGTSGHRGVFIVSDKERCMWTGAILARCLYSFIFHKYKIAMFLRADSNLYQTIGSKNISFKYFDMYNNINENILKLNEFNPDILVSPPQVLLQLVKSSSVNISPRKIISVAEILEDSDREKIERCFGLRVDQIYQCTEGFLAYTCSAGNLHINEDIIKLEKQYVDKENKRFIPIITDMCRTSQPIIRYRLNDILVEDNQKCRCGSVFCKIKKIEGRQDDIFIFESNLNKEVEVYPDYIRRCILLADDVEQYRVEQIEKNRIKIYIVSKNFNQSKEDIIQAFTKLSKDLSFKMPKIEFKDYNFDGSTKLIRVRRMF